MKYKSIVLLISGSGSNLQAIINAISSKTINAEISSVISNRPDAPGLEKAKKAGIHTDTIDHTSFPDRDTFDQQLLTTVSDYKPDLVVLAGFMRLLSDEFIKAFHGRILNIHPSLLPAFKGLNTHRRVLDKKCKTHGASVHFVNSELDSGSVIIQAEVPVDEGDNAASLATRVLEQEHIIYPLAIRWFIEEKVKLVNDAATFNNKKIQKPATWIKNILTEPT